jgi:hypothetical protein
MLKCHTALGLSALGCHAVRVPVPHAGSFSLGLSHHARVCAPRWAFGLPGQNGLPLAFPFF